jgi:putative tricarboxylic transport membrane protein
VKEPLDFIDRPIAFLLFCVILIIVGSTVWRVWREWRAPDRRTLQKKASTEFSKRISGRSHRHFENRKKQQRRRRFYDHVGS